jgi:hypothetical protein
MYKKKMYKKMAKSKPSVRTPKKPLVKMVNLGK